VSGHDDAGHAGGDDHGHGHSPWIQHHYDDAQHQFDSGKLGIWLFLAQEVLFFSALFVAYILYRHHHPEIYAYAHKYLDVKYGAINTAVLIFSSLTAAWAVRAAQLQQRKLLIACLATTLICALAFLGIKYVEYTHKIHEHLLFGERFDPCIGPNEQVLLTKNNECPGSKGSVVWNFGKQAPEIGCVPQFALDSQPEKSGMQVECTVAEAEMTRALDDKGEPLVNPDSKMALFLKPKDAKPVAKQCPPQNHGHPGTGEPCWRTAYQPAVCRPGYFFATRCTSGPGMEKLGAELAALQNALEATRGTKATAATMVQVKKLGELYVAASCDKAEKYSWSSSFKDPGDCADARTKRNDELKKVRDAEIDEKCPKLTLKGADLDNCVKAIPAGSLTTYELGECKRAEQVGIVVEHHDHEVRPATIAVTAQCKPPAKPGPAVDVYAEKAKTLQIGTAEIGTETSPPLDPHDRYAGPPPEHTNMFFTIYFAMTGLHGIHVLVGVFIFIWLLIRAVKGHFTPEYFGPVDWAALYWHIVDLIWIFLFPLMYLIH
jgi:heme/copper-type cytochrome/quinol oxidase subunit 3